ncbi:MAG: dual specificity protein phosphatase family protein, partial [Planctomycetes bacterium]|nr:dual specificity protein phosphatase family protein [Planctomycetota bacterium]
FVEAAPGIYLGRHLNGREATELRKQGVVAVLDLTSEFSRCRQLRGLPYRNVPMLDLTTPTPEHIAHCIEFIHEYEPAGAVYIHCALGYSRSACIVAAYLLKTGQAESPEMAIEILRRSRPQLVLRRDTMKILHEYSELMNPQAEDPWAMGDTEK